MNQARRKLIQELLSKLNTAMTDLESILEDEQYYYDNIPENLQSGDKYEQTEEDISNLEDAKTSLEEAISGLEKIY
jgi:chaperonin cofactor prefoldin